MDFTDLTLWQLELPNHLSHHKFVRLLLPLVVSEVAYYHSKEAGHYAPHFDWGQLGNWWREAFGGQMESKDGTATLRVMKFGKLFPDLHTLWELPSEQLLCEQEQFCVQSSCVLNIYV